MFDTVRKHQKILQLVLMLFIVPSFVLFGISGYSSFMDKETDLIKINGKPITAQEVDNAAKRQAERVGGNPQIAQSLQFRQAILNELLERSSKHKTGHTAHVINLSLLPMSPEDLQYLFDAFGTGTVSILSRGYGNCRITSTRLANVWWVQYFNSMDQILLNTLEVVDIPEVALASKEDYEESEERLREWLAVMREQ